jgi:hypothetical protein
VPIFLTAARSLARSLGRPPLAWPIFDFREIVIFGELFLRLLDLPHERLALLIIRVVLPLEVFIELDQGAGTFVERSKVDRVDFGVADGLAGA